MTTPAKPEGPYRIVVDDTLAVVGPTLHRFGPWPATVEGRITAEDFRNTLNAAFAAGRAADAGLREALEEAAAFIEEQYRQALGFASKAEKNRLVAEHVVLKKLRAALAGKQ